MEHNNKSDMSPTIYDDTTIKTKTPGEEIT